MTPRKPDKNALKKAAAATEIGTSFDDLRRHVDGELLRHFSEAEAEAGPVWTAMRESVAAGGKRLRPIMTVVAARDLGFASAVALRAGCAVELVHTASLLLDDLPCMDNAAMRRGQPAIHVRFGEDVAILASIALLSEAYAILAGLPDMPGDAAVRMVRSLSTSIGLTGLVSGQFRDLRRGPASGPEEDHAAVNDQKTGALFIAALEIAGTLAGADEWTSQCLRRYGSEIGRAFQYFDDLLDLDGDAAMMGKTAGRDVDRPTLARRIGRDAILETIDSHVGAARAALYAMPHRAAGLLALTDTMFGAAGETPEHRSGGGALLFALLAP